MAVEHDKVMEEALVKGTARRFGRDLTKEEDEVVRRVFRKKWRPDVSEAAFQKKLENALTYLRNGNLNNDWGKVELIPYQKPKIIYTENGSPFEKKPEVEV